MFDPPVQRSDNHITFELTIIPSDSVVVAYTSCLGYHPFILPIGMTQKEFLRHRNGWFFHRYQCSYFVR